MENQNANLGKKMSKDEAVVNSSEGTSQVAATGKKKNNWWKWLIGCCGGLVVVIIILSVVGYFTIGKKIINEAKKLSESESGFDIEKFQQDLFQETEDEAQDLETDAVIELGPDSTVIDYLNSTLGTLPESKLNKIEAKSYLSMELKNQFDDPSFVQQTLCIQDGPSDIKISNKDLYGEEAYITVAAQYGGEYEDIWDFALQAENDRWVIYAIYCLKN